MESKFNENKNLSYIEAISNTKEKLINSVEKRLRADVSIAFCLSGIDSNALIGIAKKVLGYDVHGFSIINTDERYEELDMIDLAVENLNLKHTKVALEKNDFLDNLRILVNYHNSPVYTITYYAQWLLKRSQVMDLRFQ